MKNILIALILAAQGAGVSAAEFSLAGLKAWDIGQAASDAGAEIPAAPRPAPAAELKQAEQVPQDLAYKFNQAKNDVRRIYNNTAFLRSDLDRLESAARRIAMTGKADLFFQGELQPKAWDISRHASDVQRAGMSLKSLLGQARPSAELNAAARDLDTEVRALLNRVQFDIESSAQRLEWAVRSAKPGLLGSGAQWSAMEITRAARDLTGKARDLSFDAQNLVSQTRP